MDQIKKEYRDAADAVRCAEVVTPAMEARYAAAKEAYDAQRAPVVQAEIAARPKTGGWWNLPIARTCWAEDGHDLNA